MTMAATLSPTLLPTTRISAWLPLAGNSNLGYTDPRTASLPTQLPWVSRLLP